MRSRAKSPAIQLRAGHPAAQSLSSCWIFSEGGGTTVRDLCAGATLTFGSGNGWEAGYGGSVVTFSGAAASVLSASARASFDCPNDVTCEALIKPNGVGAANHIIVAKIPTATPNYEFYLKNLQLYWYDGTAERASGFSVTAGVWSHVFASRIGTALTWWVNGKQVGSATVTSRGTSAGSLYIGDDSAGQYFGGSIGFVRVYRRGLIGPEIQELSVDPYGMFSQPPRSPHLSFAAAAAGGGGPFPFFTRTNALSGGFRT